MRIFNIIKKATCFGIVATIFSGLITSEEGLQVYGASYGISNEEVNEIAQIRTVEELLDFSRRVTSGETKLNAVLMNDLDLSEIENWIPIGTEKNKYEGVFDGNGKIIDNLNCNWPDQVGVGFFGFLGRGSKVIRLTLKSVEVTGKEGVGALAGYNIGDRYEEEANIVEDCHVEGGFVSGLTDIGGFFGWAYNVNMSGSSSKIQVLCQENVAGGLIGWGLASIKMNGCKSMSQVICKGSQVGGFMGLCIQGMDIVECDSATYIIGGGEYVGIYIGCCCSVEEEKIIGCKHSGTAIKDNEVINDLVGYGNVTIID